jgi:hypothetical protein
MAGKRLRKVRCLKCRGVVGLDPDVKSVESCLSCSRKRKEPSVKGTASLAFARTKKGPAKDLPDPEGSIVMRSSWERNFARYLHLKGIPWTYERKVFTFNDVARRPFQYIPDFYETAGDVYWEVKGFLRGQDRMKMKRFRKQYPEEFGRLKACCSKNNKAARRFYDEMGVPMTFIEDIRKDYKDQIPAWE